SVIRDRASTTASRAIEYKAERLGRSAADLLLLVFFDVMRYRPEIDLGDMRSAASWAARKIATRHGARFLEIWSLWSFVDQPGEAHCLWEATEENAEDRLPTALIT